MQDTTSAIQNEPVNKQDLIIIRDARREDIPFIMSSWLNGLRYGNDWYTLIEKTVYFKVYHSVLEKLLSKPAVTVKVACLKDETDAILGYSVFEGDRLHWVQVKEKWRKIGLAKDLVPQQITTVSHLTKIGKAIFVKKKLIFNPFLLV